MLFVCFLWSSKRFIRRSTALFDGAHKQIRTLDPKDCKKKNKNIILHVYEQALIKHLSICDTRTN